MNAQRISTTIAYEQWQLIQKNNWKYSEIIKRGIGSLMQPDALKERMFALEKQVETLIKARNRGWR